MLNRSCYGIFADLFLQDVSTAYVRVFPHLGKAHLITYHLQCEYSYDATFFLPCLLQLFAVALCDRSSYSTVPHARTAETSQQEHRHRSEHSNAS